MIDLIAYVSGIGVRGPGLSGWLETHAVLSGGKSWAWTETALPVPETLPPTERRRTGRVVRLAFAAGLEATRQASVDPAGLPIVFSSSSGDGDNCNEICKTLATANRELSPTRFHNSVHNAPAGYWSIATGSQVASTTICAYDASFAAGLLEAVVQMAAQGAATALIAYDIDYPQPLRAVRATAAPFAIALVLQPDRGHNTLARLNVRLDEGDPDRVVHPDLNGMLSSIPAAHGLILLEAIAARSRTSLNIRYLEPQTLHIEVSP
ncbi:MAG: beta-ketoacyl synthase chain length factor [Gammaproteobacteria bacterium]